ncbi:MAG: MerR family transcriptional regulator [Brumimicrobium sp.]
MFKKTVYFALSCAKLETNTSKNCYSFVLVYKIKDIEILTGIKAHTLRVWEKRYNLFNPERTNTKIRTYSDKDLKKALNISVLYKKGWKISKLAKLSDEEISNEVIQIYSSKEISNVVISLLIQSLIDFDNIRFERILNNAISKEGLHYAYFNYILPFLKHVGVMWSVGAIQPAHEHFVSNIVRQKIIASIDDLEEEQTGEVDYVLYCPEHEWHEIGLLFYYYVLKNKGFRVLYLGACSPIESVLKTTDLLKPKAVVASFVTSIDSTKLEEHLVAVRKKFNNPIYLGGSYIEDIDLSKFKQVLHIKSLIPVQ